VAIQVLLNNGGGVVDITRYVLDGSLKVEDSINVPNLCNFTLGNIDNLFTPPVRNSYIQVFSTKESRFLFTGFVTSVPQVDHLGSGANSPNTLFQRQSYVVQATSDEYLLNIKSIPFIPAFVNQTMGQILSNLANILAPGFFDVTSRVQAGDLIPYFQYDPTQKWSDLAKTFCDAARFYYQMVNKQLVFEPYSGTSLGVSYNEILGQGTFDPYSLKSSVLTVPPVNDAIVIGDVEPQNIRDDYFIGDGVTSSFPLRHAMFRGSSRLLLQEDWTEAQFSNNWNVVDPQFAFSLGSGSLASQMSASGALGTEYIQGQNGVELGGHLDMQHGEFFFTGMCNGLVGGVYSTSPPTQAACLLGFSVAPPISGVQLAQDAFSAGNWISPANGGFFNGFIFSAGSAKPQSVGTSAAANNQVTWPNDQYSEITMAALPAAGTSIGPAVRFNGSGNGYAALALGPFGNSVLIQLGTYLSGGFSSLISGNFALNSGDLLRLEVQGQVLTVKINGVPVLSISDSSYSSGPPGIGGAGTTAQASAWTGGTFKQLTTSVTVTFSGASGLQIQPILNGIPLPGSTPVTVKINHHYFLETFITARRWSRYDQIYRTLAGTPFGDTFLPAQAMITFIVWDIDLLHPETPTPTKYYTTASLPSFGLYVPLNAVQLNLTLNYTLLNQPPQGLLTVQSLYGPTGLNLPIKTPGPVEPYNLGFGFGQQVATIVGQQGGGVQGVNADALQFYAGSLSNLNTWVGGTIPAAGARIHLQSWAAGKALARVQDPTSISNEGALVGDNGFRTGVFADLNPLPRTSEEAALAASATISDREAPQYDGSYTIYDYFRDKTQDFPRSGRYLPVYSPPRGIGGQNYLLWSSAFMVSSVWTTTQGLTVSGNSAVAPDGTLSADELIYDGSGSAGAIRISQASSNTAVAGPYTVSIWLKAAAPVNVVLGNGQGQTLVCHVTTSWQKFFISVTQAGTFTPTLSIASPAGVNTAFAVFAWGAQAELNAAPLPTANTTSLIQTSYTINFLVRSVNVSVESLPDEVIVSTLEFGQDLFVEKLLKRFLPTPTNVLEPQDSAITPPAQTLNSLGTMFTGDFLDLQVLSIARGQNLLSFSQSFDQTSAWTAVQTGVTPNNQIAPDGTLTADTLAFNGHAANTLAGIEQNVTPPLVGGQSFTLSVWLKSTGAQTVELVVQDNPQASFSLILSAQVNQNWQRFILSGTAPANSNPDVQVQVRSPFGSAQTAFAAYAWGAQLEQHLSVGDYVSTTNGPSNSGVPQVWLDLGALPVTGAEIRRVDSGWGINSVGLVTSTTSRYVTLHRSQYEQIWYVRQINGAAVSRFSRVIRIVYPLVPGAPYATANITDPLRPLISIGLTGDLRNIRFSEIRDSDNATLLFKQTFASFADLIFTYDNTIALKRNFNWFVYYANLQNEYSPAFNFQFTIPPPVCTLVVDGESLTLAVNVSGIQVGKVDFQCFKDASLTMFAASGSAAVNFAVSGSPFAVAVTFPLTVDDAVGQRYFQARATDPIGTGPWSAVLSHIYTALGLVSFDNVNNVIEVPTPPSPNTDPVIPSPFQPYSGDLINESWQQYVRQINRQYR